MPETPWEWLLFVLLGIVIGCLLMAYPFQPL